MVPKWLFCNFISDDSSFVIGADYNDDNGIVCLFMYVFMKILVVLGSNRSKTIDGESALIKGFIIKRIWKHCCYTNLQMMEMEMVLLVMSSIYNMLLE